AGEKHGLTHLCITVDDAGLIAIVDKKLGRTDPALQMRVGHFRYFDGGGNRKAALARLSKAGRDGPEFLERLAARDAQQAAHEFKRDNVARGISLAKAVLKRFPESEAAGTARKLVEAAYARMQWDAVGRRTWKRKDGAYTAAPRRVAGSLLRSQRQYQNFELRLEWRSDAPNGQGGVFFRYPGAGNPIDTAYKIQLSDDFGVPADNFCTGALFKIQAPTANAVKARGEWNALLLRVEGERVHVVINGRTVLRTKAKSETIPRKGYVALDGGLGGITYRRTLLYELPKSQ
ncbi:MAG: DUF1080 domain-containing protein, partial [Planctomycetaceae bacterium]